MFSFLVMALIKAIALGVIAILTYLSVDFLIKKYRKRNNTVVVAAEMKEVVKMAKNKGARMSFDQLNDLEKAAQENSTVISEYDERTDELVQIQLVKDADDKIKRAIHANDGIIVLQD